ncbi:PAS domain S-box protein [uncultured Methanospirillum sp.]|uniref:PAS domain S-box protein n=1 Tax=uncultured Methanospirillum sp. TaxID=262503 RepID=UPI0029C8C9FE|nr:PAS domain S-box protein [uncultured Methanospirillum sp.]
MQEISIIRVLFVDDNEDLCRIFRLFLESSREFSVFTCLSAEDGLEYLKAHQVDAVVSDYAMPYMNGIEFLKIIKQQYPDLPFIMLTGEDSKEIAIEALNAGADFYQNKGDELDIQTLDIAKKVRVLVSQREAVSAVRRKDAILEAISYAAEQFLKGTILHIDSRDILGRLGVATGADLVYLVNVRDCETEPTGCEVSVVWSRTENGQPGSPSHWPEHWHSTLTTSRSFSGGLSTVSPVEREFFQKEGIASLLVLPIYANSQMCGYLVFEDHEQEQRRSSIEIQTLIMAAEIIGSARYRRHIEEFYKSPVEEANLGIFLFCDTVFRYVNPRICSIFGYRREELLKLKDPLVLIHPSDHELFTESITKAMEGVDQPHNFECTGIRKDGREIFLEIYLTTIKLLNSRCIAGNIIDITDRRIIQQSLQESEQRYRRLAEQLDDLILVIDPSWIITYVNPAGMTAFPGLGNGPLSDIRSVFTDEIYAGFLGLVGESIGDGSIRSWSMEIPLPDQESRWFDISITPLKIDDGQISSLVVYFHDVSFRVQREEEIRRAGLAQLELNMEQFQILNDEIRNPIQVIKGLNLLQGGEYSGKIEVQLGIINDLIDKLDRAWVQSEKVHKFLLRHYQHGMYMERDTDSGT